MRLLAIHLVLAVSWWHLVRGLGGFGLVLLGVLNSVLPLPGSVDVLTVILAARHRDTWEYYAVMATVGSVAGGYITYQLARTGGKETLYRRLSPEKGAALLSRFERWGFGTIVVAGLLPPPIPMIPFLLAAGAMQYSRRKFLVSLTLGRSIRYSAVALVAARYGGRIFSRLAQSYGLLAIVCVAILAIILIGFFWLRRYITYRPGKEMSGPSANAPAEIKTGAVWRP